MTSDNPVITIDGPAASGKGTLAQRLAAELQFHLLDSGLLYRIVGYTASQAEIDLNDGSALETFMRDRLVFRINEAPSRDRDTEVFEVYVFRHVGIADIVRVNDINVNLALRSLEAGVNSSLVSALPEVRSALIPIQRSMQQRPGLVADGRDMGTVVFPDAQLKFYVDAEVEERARRRMADAEKTNEQVSLEQMIADLEARDKRDTQRTVAPLKAAEDAIRIDTTTMSKDDMVNTVRTAVKDSLGI